MIFRKTGTHFSGSCSNACALQNGTSPLPGRIVGTARRQVLEVRLDDGWKRQPAAAPTGRIMAMSLGAPDADSYERARVQGERRLFNSTTPADVSRRQAAISKVKRFSEQQRSRI